MADFEGFPPTTMLFRSELAANNDRQWFEENRDRYESEVRGPALAFLRALEKPVGKLTSRLKVSPKKVGGSLMRIHRDVRFSKDKSPYKTNIGIHLRHEAGRDVHAPGAYVHIEPDDVFLGVGIWHPDSTALKAIRERIANEPKVWKRVRDAKRFRERFELAGDTLKRPPRGFDAEHPYIEDLKRKDFIGVQSLDPGMITSRLMVKETVAAIRDARAFMEFLCVALRLPWTR